MTSTAEKVGNDRKQNLEAMKWRIKLKNEKKVQSDNKNELS